MLGNAGSVICRGAVIAGLVVATLGLSSCGSFFQCEGKADCGTSSTGTGGTSSGNYAYVSNSTNGSTYLNEYDIGSGTLAAIVSPANLGFVPVAMAVAPNDAYMYIGSSTGSIYEYAIGSNGALSIDNGGNAVGIAPTGITSFDVSADGNWLFASDDVGISLYEFQITASSGALGSPQSISIGTGAAIPTSVHVSPNENLVVCTLGLNGAIVFPYASSDGITSTNFISIPTNSGTVSDLASAIDTNNFLYMATTTGPAVYQLANPSANVVSATPITQSSLTNGSGPHSVALNATSGGVVYVGNFTDSTISAYSQSSGKLTNIVTTAYTAPTNVLALQADKTGKYLLAAGYNVTSGIQLYTIGSTGALTAGPSAASGGTVQGIPALIAVTH